MRTFTSGRLTLAFRDAGRGPAIVMLHNGGTSSTIWRHQIEALSDRFRVVAVDLPGFGASPRPEVPARLGEMVDAVAELVRSEDLAPALLVGNCMGANIAATLTREHADLVAGLVVVNPLTEATFGSGGIGFLHRMERFAPGPTRFARSWSRRIPIPRPLASASLRFQLGKAGVAADLHHDPELLACQMRGDQMPALVDVLDDMSAYGDLDEESIPSDVPVWLVWGAQNRVLSRGSGEHLTDRLHPVDVEVLEGTGHLPMLEDPDRVTAFLETCAEFVHGDRAAADSS